MAHTMRLAPACNARSVRSRFMTTVREESTRTVVVLRGDADISVRSVLSDTLSRVIALRAGDVVVDLAEVENIDTAIVDVLAVCAQLLDRHGRELIFRSPSRPAARMLRSIAPAVLIKVRQRRTG
jgi:anti-anti-sigma factor